MHDETSVPFAAAPVAASPAPAPVTAPADKEERSIPMLILTGLAFLLPLFFIPYSAVGVAFIKTLLAAYGVVIAFGLLLVRDVRARSITFPKTLVIPAALAVPAAYLAAALAAPSFSLSFFGQGLEADTAFAIFIAFLAFGTALVACRSRGHAVYLLVALAAAGGVLALFHLLRFAFGAEVLSLGLFGNQTTSPIGRWNDLGLFMGLIALLAWFALATFPLKRRFTVFFAAALAIALGLLALVNFSVVWILLGSAAGLFLASALFRRFRGGARAAGAEGRFRLATVAVIVLSAVFLVDSYAPALFGREGVIGKGLVNTFNVAQLEARPSWRTTLGIGREVYGERLLTGSGPNTFGALWLLHKPAEINQTIFWNTNFSSAIGFIPTSLITTGLVGAAAWALFLGLFFLLGFRALSASLGDPLLRYLTRVSFLLSAYLWLAAVLYPPGYLLIILAATLSGVFVALARQAAVVPTRSLSLTEHSRIGFAVALTAFVLLIVGVFGLYSGSLTYAAAVQFNRGVTALGAQDLEAADQAVTRAIALSEKDRYQQLSAQIAIARVTRALAENPNPPQEELEGLRTRVQEAVGRASAATLYDGRNYYNWLTLGQIYAALARLGVSGARENAVMAYGQAMALNPTSPIVPLSRAQLAASEGDFDSSRALLAEALALKQDYTAALVFLSQLEIASGDADRATAALRAAASTVPANPPLFFQLGFLEYSQGNAPGAIQAFEQAVSLAEDYANARYFLGLSYARAGRAEEAIRQFERIEELNPESQEVKFILGNLRAGKDPLEGIPPPPPEQRPAPPLSE